MAQIESVNKFIWDWKTGKTNNRLLQHLLEENTLSGVPKEDFINGIKNIAETKMQDLNTDNAESAERMVAGTARSMGIKVE